MSMLKESDGKTYSSRRVLAFIAFFSGVGLGLFGILKGSDSWTVFLPSLASFACSILFLFFTTWSAIKGVIKAARGNE